MMFLFNFFVSESVDENKHSLSTVSLWHAIVCKQWTIKGWDASNKIAITTCVQCAVNPKIQWSEYAAEVKDISTQF